MKTVNIYTDGACSGNPGVGGYGAILECEGKMLELSEGFNETTNNRMELLSAIVALETLKFPCKVNLCSDSKYLCDSISKGWVYSWRAKGWRKSDGKPALNTDLWERMLKQLDIHSVTVNWVKGHNGHPQNERCDLMAVEAIRKIKENKCQE